MPFGEIPRGISDAKVYVLDGSGVPGTAIDVPGVRGLSANTESDSDSLEGDNAVIAVARNPKSVTGSVELGKMNLAALAAFTGNTASTSGTTPNQIISLEEAASQTTQYVQIVGQAPSQDATGSAYRLTIYKALVTSGPDEDLTVNDWSTPTLDFEAVENASGKLLKRQNYETLVALT